MVRELKRGGEKNRGDEKGRWGKGERFQDF
jgi:hypothetical protein